MLLLFAASVIQALGQDTWQVVADGSVDTTQIPDLLAYRMFFLSYADGNTPIQGLSTSDAQALSNALASFNGSYQTQVINFSANGGSVADTATNRDNLVQSTMTTLGQNMSSNGYLAMDAFVQAHK